MHSIKISNRGQRLYVRLSGYFDLTSANNVIFDMNNLRHRLKPGFTVISIIHDIKPANEEVLKKICTSNKLLEEMGVSNIIRVVGASKYALTIFAKYSCCMNLKQNIFYVPSVKDAEEKATELEKDYLFETMITMN